MLIETLQVKIKHKIMILTFGRNYNTTMLVDIL